MILSIVSLTLLLGGDRVDDAVGAGPQPAPVPISWEFELRALSPRKIEVQLAGAAKPETFWYMVYTVVNTSGATQRFYPTIQLVTEELQVVDTDMGIGTVVFDAIRERHKNTHKYLVDPAKAIGDLGAGEDNARESVAIWRDVDVQGTNFSIFAAGLSGETQVVRNPAHVAGKPETRAVRGPDGQSRSVTVNPKNFVLRKTLELRYVWPGADEVRDRLEPRLVSANWIMR